MRRGVFHYALASRPAALQAVHSLVLQSVQCTRQRLIAAITVTLLFLLLLSPAVKAASHSASEAAAHSQPYAAWSCRGVYHVVRRGETIYSIARRYGTTAYRVAVCNGLASYTVYVGQTLLVPTAR